MNVLLDECVDRRFAKHIVGHDVKTVAEMGWNSKRNGELLGLAEILALPVTAWWICVP